MESFDNNRKINFVKKLNFSLITLLLSIMGLLLIGETFCRIKFYLRFKDSYYLLAPFKEFKKPTVEYRLNIEEFNVNDGTGNYYYKMKPGSYLPPKPYDYGTYTINSHGFRGKEFDLFNKGEKIRIFCIGESSTFGIESPDNQTWPFKLDQYLNHNSNRFEVINSGFPGAASITYKNLIRNELINYKPDIFIIYAGANEMIIDRHVKEKKMGEFINYLHNKLYYKSSMLYTLLIEKISILISKSPAPINVYNSNPKENFVSNIKEVIRICKDNNIKLIFVRQMYYSHMDLFLRDDLSLEQIRKILKKNKQEGWITDEKIFGFNEINKSLLWLCAGYGISVMDFRGEFFSGLLNNDQLYYDYIHLTPKGNDMLARLLSQKLLLLK